MARVRRFSLVLVVCVQAFAAAIAVQSQGYSPSVDGSEGTLPGTTATASIADAPDHSPTSAPSDETVLVEHNILFRPIAVSDDYTHWVDRSYPYGSTQLSQRQVHLGVEFVNPRGTSVYAAKSGIVVFAGADARTLFGPDLDYYGNLVVLAHNVHSLSGKQVFTLYGHLESVALKAGDVVDDLGLVGKVGSTGVAIGAHLHFEVRVADPFDYRQTRNPELWLQHYIDHGLIIGSIRDEAGDFVYGRRVNVRSASVSRDVYSYGSDLVNPDPAWGENFSLGDLPAGDYLVTVLNADGNIDYRSQVTVESYRTSRLNIVLEG